MNVSDTRRFWDGVWCTPPVFSKSAEVFWNVWDTDIQISGVCKRLKRLEMQERVDSVLVCRFPLWDGRGVWRVVEQRITEDDSTFLLICQ